MPERIFIGVAWPYANGSLHIGQLAGAYLPPDIFARYHRTAGNDVLMVSGSDIHGTPITIRAEQEGRTPQELTDEYQREFLATWEGMGISFDLFTTTGTENHYRVTQDMFLKLLETGDIYEGEMDLPYCTVEKRFLLDRYVEGTCPICGFEGARGDQCDNCGNVLDPVDLINPRCKFDGSTPEIRSSKHFFHALSAYNEPLLAWLKDGKDHWRRNVLNFSVCTIETGDGLRDRSITRDIDWGVPIPLEGWDDKRIYVWFDASSATSPPPSSGPSSSGEPEALARLVAGPLGEELLLHRQGQHLVPHPHLARQAHGLHEGRRRRLQPPLRRPGQPVPHDQGRARSPPAAVSPSGSPTTSPATTPIPSATASPPPCPRPPTPTSPGPPSSSATTTSSSPPGATSSTASSPSPTRTSTPTSPLPAPSPPPTRALIATAEQAIADTGRHIAACNFRAGLESAMAAAREANRYVEENAPWKLLKEDRDRCATVLHTALTAINGIKTALYPYLPFTCERLHTYLGLPGTIQDAGWQLTTPEPGASLHESQPLFKKLDPELIEAEEARLGT